MDIVRNLPNNRIKPGGCVTIGNFDGVHLGHQALIKRVLQKAKQNGGQAIVLTMYPLPLQFFQGRNAVQIITPFKEKAKLLASMGVDVMCVLQFNQALAAMSAEDFFKQIIKQGLDPSFLLVGDDFRFGAKRRGDADFLQAQCQQHNIEFAQSHSIQKNKLRVSSSLLREQLSAGQFDSVEKLLDRPFMVTSRVANGRRLGRTLGFPTLNLPLKAGAFALSGVYVVSVKINHKWYQGAASVGYNPTVDGVIKRLEVHVLNFSQMIYGQTVQVLFHKKLRDEVKFAGLAELKSAIAADVAAVSRYFTNNLEINRLRNESDKNYGEQSDH